MTPNADMTAEELDAYFAERDREDAEARAVGKRWSYVSRLCSEAAKASDCRDGAKVRRLVVRILRHTELAEHLSAVAALPVIEIPDEDVTEASGFPEVTR